MLSFVSASVYTYMHVCMYIYYTVLYCVVYVCMYVYHLNAGRETYIQCKLYIYIYIYGGSNKDFYNNLHII